MTRFALSFVLASSLLATTAMAQVAGGTSIRGVVIDSISGQPLGGAAIQLVARDDAASLARTATSDQAGRYRLDDVPNGQYRIGFLHPVLDSLGIESPLRDVTVNSERAIIEDLAVPSVATLRSLVCGMHAAEPASGLIIGIVHDGRDGAPTAGATVSGEWIELAVTRARIDRRLARKTATTTESGWFALCDVPESGNVALVAGKGADSTGTVEVQMPPSGFLRRELYLGRSSTEESPTRPQSSSNGIRASRRIHVGDGRISGSVVAVAGKAPVAGAQVGIVDGPETRTNDRGEWTITNAPFGTRMIEVRAIGYYPVQRQVDVVAGAAPLIIALPTLKAVLDTVKIIAKRLPGGPDGGDFLRRKRMGQGRYITPADLARNPVINTSEVFRRMPGVMVDKEKIKMRGAFQEAQGRLGGENWCDAAIYINGHNMSFMSIEDINDYVPPHQVAGIEVYSEATAPPQFQPGLTGCGAVVIWTK